METKTYEAQDLNKKKWREIVIRKGWKKFLVVTVSEDDDKEVWCVLRKEVADFRYVRGFIFIEKDSTRYIALTKATRLEGMRNTRWSRIERFFARSRTLDGFVVVKDGEEILSGS